ncbi:MAG: hypothetical protein M9949_14115 [Candidatus Kapabacteria bacterium]|nr:hypothetical protein [Candidatus Kapabacteria bacterium]
MEHIISVNITTEVHEVELKETKIAVLETDSSTANNDVGHNHDERYYTKAVIDGKLDLIHTTGEVINGHRLVYLKDGLAYKASNDNPECFNRLVGMSVNSASLGDAVTVRTGKIVNPGWGLSANAIYYLGLDGNITLTSPSTGIWQIVGYASDTETLIVNIEIGIMR